MSKARSLTTHPIHLGLGAKAVPQPEFTGLEWYAAYAERVASDRLEGRLVSMHRFEEDWDEWEMHPKGAEVVVCCGGSLTLHQEYPDGRIDRVTLQAGDYAINEPGVWHTADTDGANALFITSGEGTEHRER